MSNGVELLSRGSRALERLQSLLPLMRRPAFHFIGREGPGVHEREKERRKEKEKETRWGRKEP
jgi:hypothetical protein